jgi:hypothetical protein
MATNTLQTDWHEARALLTPRLVLVVCWARSAVLAGVAAPSPRPWKQRALRNLARPRRACCCWRAACC